MKMRLLAIGTAALFALTACGGSTEAPKADDSAGGGESTSSESTSAAPNKEPSESKSNPLVKPSSSPSTMKEVGERLGLDLIKKSFIVEATKKVDKYPNTKAGEAALTEAAARGCQDLKDSGGGDAAGGAVRKWAADEGLTGKDAQAVLLVALVSVCPEEEKLLPQG